MLEYIGGSGIDWASEGSAAALSVHAASTYATSAAKAMLHNAMSSSFYCPDDKKDRSSWPVFIAAAAAHTTSSLSVTMFTETEDAARSIAYHLIPVIRRACKMLQTATLHPMRVALVYVDDDRKRLLPSKKGSPIMPCHINGGMTYLLTKVTPVIVWRREDAVKVALHELVHAQRLDFGLHLHLHHDIDVVCTKMGVKRISIDIDQSIGLHDVYSEVLACVMYSRANGIDPVSMSSAADLVAAEMLAHFGRTSMLLVSSSSSSSTYIVEGTNASAYVLGRAAFLRPSWCTKLLRCYPPGSPPTDPDEFSKMLLDAMASWDASMHQ